MFNKILKQVTIWLTGLNQQSYSAMSRVSTGICDHL